MKRIKFKAKFKKAILFNETLHIILYPEDGLRTAVKLQSIKEGTGLVFSLKRTDKKAFKYHL